MADIPQAHYWRARESSPLHQGSHSTHNYLRVTESGVYCTPRFVDGEDGAGNQISGGWRGEDDPCARLASLGQVGGNR